MEENKQEGIELKEKVIEYYSKNKKIDSPIFGEIKLTPQ
jgi:hypothetical protein